MKNVVKNIIKILNKNSYLVLIFIFIFGVLFRTIYPGNVELGCDQIQILVNAHQIISGDKPLVGPTTGPVAGMYTGPLIYYLAVPFVKTLGDFHSIVVIPLLLSVITGLSLFFLSKRYLGKKPHTY